MAKKEMKATVTVDAETKATAMKPFLKKLETLGKTSVPAGKTSKKGLKSLMAKAGQKQKQSIEQAEKARAEAKAKREEERQKEIDALMAKNLTIEEATAEVDARIAKRKEQAKKQRKKRK